MRKAYFSTVLVVAAFFTMPAKAAFPERNITILCGFAAGGTCDLVARLIARIAAVEFKQSVIVENRTGATGVVAATAVARSQPDGHTVLLCAQGPNVMLPELPGAKIPIDMKKEIVPVANMALANFIMVVPASKPWKSVSEFVAAAKTENMTFGSAGIGTLQHLAGEVLNFEAGLKLTHVPYRGATPAATDVIAGRIDTLITNLGDVSALIAGGQLRPLAFTDTIGSPILPDVPRMSQFYPNFVLGGWFGICGPAGMPAEAIERWHAALKRTAEDPEVKEVFERNGLMIKVENAADFQARFASDRRVLGDFIQKTKLQVE